MPDRTPLDIVRAAEGTELRYETDESPERLELLAPMDAAAIERLAAAIPCPLPDSIRSLLEHTRGLANGPLETLEIGGIGAFEFPEVFPCPIDIAHDGFGNYWVVDLTSASTTWGPIYFACHDPPVIVYQSPDLSHFLEETLKLGDPAGPRSELDIVHEEHSLRVWRENPGVLSREECVASGDPVLEAFARELPTGYKVVDLRGASIGDGFSWGRSGPQTATRRAGEQAVFAYEKRSRGQRLGDWLGLTRGRP